MTQDVSHDSHVARLSVTEAAEWLGVSASAVRKRVERGTLQADKDEDGRVYVYLDMFEETRRETPRDMSHDTAITALVEQLRDENAFLRRELERKDTIIMSLTQRIPELEPPPEPREGPSEAHDSAGKGDGTPEPQKAAESSWLRRFFGL